MVRILYLIFLCDTSNCDNLDAIEETRPFVSVIEDGAPPFDAE